MDTQLSTKLKLVYDMQSLPQGLDPGNLTKIFEQHHIIYWDSSKGGTKPALYKASGQKLELAIVDTKGSEMDMKRYSEEFKDAEFWDKEMHNCQHSPTYFYANYGSTVYPHTREGLRAYLKEIGLSNEQSTDSTKAAELWEEQKKVLKRAMAHVTVEFLKERRAAMDVMKATHDANLKSLESILKDHVKLFDTRDQPLPEKNRITKLAEKIRPSSPVLKKYSDIYRTKKGRWDNSILINTPYWKLLEIYYDVLDSKGIFNEDAVDSTTD